LGTLPDPPVEGRRLWPAAEVMLLVEGEGPKGQNRTTVQAIGQDE